MISPKFVKTLPVITLVFLFSCFFVFSPEAGRAQSLLQDSETTQYSPAKTDAGTGSTDNCFSDGSCQLNDFVRVVVRVTEIILGIIGAVALLFFVYGGVKMIISAGSSEKVEEAKTVVRNAVVGLAIVFVSWTIINFVVASLGYDASTFGAWFEAP